MKRGSINHDVRINNGKVVTNIIFHSEPMTKQDLAARAGMSLPTITTILNRLQECNLITQGSKQQSTGGRPAQQILPVYSAAYSIGVYISPNHVRFCLTDLAPQMIAKTKYALSFDNTREYWRQVYGLFLRFKEEFRVEESKLLGVGFALNIMSHSAFGKGEIVTILSGNRLIDLDTRHIREAFKGCSIEIRNDAKMAALAQTWSNPAFTDYIYLSMNNNVAGAIVASRGVVGFDKRNAEFGHMIIVPGGRECVCGMKGCFDAYCSVSALQSASGLALNAFFERLDKGDEHCLKVWNQYLYYFTIMLSNIRVCFDSDIVVGGILSQYLGHYKNELAQRFKDLHLLHSEGEYNETFLHISDLGEYGSAMGAGLVFNDEYLSNIFN